jgi:hypothetical protein
MPNDAVHTPDAPNLLVRNPDLELRFQVAIASVTTAQPSVASFRLVAASDASSLVDEARTAHSTGSRNPIVLVMHVIFQDISTSRCGCLSTELEASRCRCPTGA